MLISSYLLIVLIIVILVILGKIFQQAIWERAEKEKQKAGELAWIEEYFKERPPLWQLYQYAKNCGIAFEIQPAREALDNIINDSVNWSCKYYQKVKKTKKGIRTFGFSEPQIVVPLDVLIIKERRVFQSYFFLIDKLQDLIDKLQDSTLFVKKGPDLSALKIIIEFVENLERQIKETNEEFLKETVFAFSHEIGHWKLIQKEISGRLETCSLIIESDFDFPSCLLKELAASLEGLAILKELGLSDYVDRRVLLKEKRAIFQQCDSCQKEINESRCPVAEKIQEVLKKFS